MDELVILGIIAGFVGIILGTLVNLLVFRTRLSGVLGERVDRDACEFPSRGSDYLPFASFFSIKDHCTGKKVAVWQYPAVELLSAILVTALFLRAYTGFAFPDFVDSGEWFLLFVRDTTVALFFLVIFIYDFRYRVILDRMTIPAIIAVFLFQILLGANLTPLVLTGLLLGAFFAVQYALTHGKAMGGGDIRLALVIGLYLGPALGVLSVFLAYILGSIVGIYLILRRHEGLHDHMPFGTFLVLGAFVSLLFGADLIEWYMALLVN